MDPNQTTNGQGIQPQPNTPPSQQVQQQVQQTTASKSSNKGKKAILMGVIVFIILILLMSAIFVLDSKKNNIKQNTNKPTPAITPTATVVPTIPLGKLSENLTLKKGIETQVPDSNLNLTFEGKDEPKDCTDCYITTKVKLRIDDKSYNLSFVCGGLVGGCTNETESNGYSFEITKNVEEDQIGIKVTEK